MRDVRGSLDIVAYLIAGLFVLLGICLVAWACLAP